MYHAEMALSAIKKNQLAIYGQKIFGIMSHDDAYDWYEILVRIQSDDGLIYPNHFIPVLEQFGHITTLDKTVLRQAIAFLANNLKFKFSINLSGLSIVKPDLIETIKESLAFHDVKPNRVCFETTESAAFGQGYHIHRPEKLDDIART